jgi:hypothetical protein
LSTTAGRLSSTAWQARPHVIPTIGRLGPQVPLPMPVLAMLQAMHGSVLQAVLQQ